MRLAHWETLVDDSYSTTADFRRVRSDIEAAIRAVVWPPGSDQFIVNPTRQGNGVKPIKSAFIASLEQAGWEPEVARFDAHLDFANPAAKPFAVEWETGNISSSHRAINRMALGMHDGRIAGGVLVLPTRALYPFLTDRIGNFAELESYFPLWTRWQGEPGFQYLAIVAVEHDMLDPDVPLIGKGTDGRALI